MSSTGATDEAISSGSGAFLRALARAPAVEPPAPEPDRAGQTVARFELVEKLGEGAMGVVYLARDPALDRELALKLLRARAVADPARRARFMREARSIARVVHPFVATIFDVGEDGDVVFLAMERVRGRTLRRVLEDEGRLASGEVARIARSIALGLERAHAAGVIHRDLKPENVMLTDEGEIKILDFGLAKLGHDALDEPREAAHSAAGRVVGTPHYMSPEQAAGRDVDARTDLYALGVMLVELSTGSRPTRGRALSLPRALARVARRCLAEDPSARYASAAEVARALEPRRSPRAQLAIAAGALAIGVIAWLATRPPLLFASARGPTPELRAPIASTGSDARSSASASPSAEPSALDKPPSSARSVASAPPSVSPRRPEKTATARALDPLGDQK
ncbi:MAG: serine/threonine-protein kinase [Polyangiaceae bacterium]